MCWKCLNYEDKQDKGTLSIYTHTHHSLCESLYLCNEIPFPNLTILSNRIHKKGYQHQIEKIERLEITLLK